MNQRLKEKEIVKESEKVVEQLNGLYQELEDLVQKTESLKNDPGKWNKIQQPFLRALSRKWIDLSPQFQNLTSWEEIVKLQQDLRDFIMDSRKVILSPDRTEILKLMEEWLSKMGLKFGNQFKEWVEKSLEEAEDQNLQGIRESLNKLQNSVLQSENLQNQFQRWIEENKLGELLKQEKTSTHFLDWLHSVQNGFQDALNLEKEITTIETTGGKDFHHNAIAEALFQKFIQVLQREIQTFTPDKAPIFWKDKMKQTNTWWKTVKPNLEYFKIFDDFSKFESDLIAEEIKNYEISEYNDFNLLLRQLKEYPEKFQNLKKILVDIKSQTSSLTSDTYISENISESEVYALAREIQEICSEIPNASLYTSTNEYLNSLDQVKKRFEEWQEKFRSKQEHLRREIDFWLTLCEKQNKTQFLDELADLKLKVGTIGEIIQSYSRLNEFSEELKSDLKSGEKEVLNTIISRLEDGETNLLDIIENLPDDDFEKDFVSLARRKIIKVIVKLT